MELFQALVKTIDHVPVYRRNAEYQDAAGVPRLLASPGGVLLSTSITYCRPQVAWVTVAGWSVSLAASPALTHLCRNHSVRLVAVIGTQAGHGRRYSLSLPQPLLNARASCQETFEKFHNARRRPILTVFTV